MIQSRTQSFKVALATASLICVQYLITGLLLFYYNYKQFLNHYKCHQRPLQSQNILCQILGGLCYTCLSSHSATPYGMSFRLKVLKWKIVRFYVYKYYFSCKRKRLKNFRGPNKEMLTSIPKTRIITPLLVPLKLRTMMKLHNPTKHPKTLPKSKSSPRDDTN